MERNRPSDHPNPLNHQAHPKELLQEILRLPLFLANTAMFCCMPPLSHKMKFILTAGAQTKTSTVVSITRCTTTHSRNPTFRSVLGAKTATAQCLS
eukprot:1665792-Amphidinium_carterae.1